MPITFDDRVISGFRSARLSEQLAEYIRAAIESSELEPGESLPGEDEIAARVGISRTPVRKAMDELARDGLIVRRVGASTRVARLRPTTRVAANRYRETMALLLAGEEPPVSSAFVKDMGIEWDAYSVNAKYREERATDDEAKRLQVEPGTLVLRRVIVKYADGLPTQRQESVMPLELVEDTPVSDPKRQPWPWGTLGELHSIDQVVTRVEEDIRARFPHEEERDDLIMEASAPVLEVRRVFFVGERPVEISSVVLSAAHTVLHFTTDLTDLG